MFEVCLYFNGEMPVHFLKNEEKCEYVENPSVSAIACKDSSEHFIAVNA